MHVLESGDLELHSDNYLPGENRREERVVIGLRAELDIVRIEAFSSPIEGNVGTSYVTSVNGDVVSDRALTEIGTIDEISRNESTIDGRDGVDLPTVRCVARALSL